MCLRVARLMSLTIFLPGLFVVFLIVHSSVATMSNKPSLQEALSGNVALREGYFWACFDLAEALEEPENDWQRFVRSDYGRILRPFAELDSPWLLRALAIGAIGNVAA